MLAAARSTIGPCSVGSSRAASTSPSRRPVPAAAARATPICAACRPAPRRAARACRPASRSASPAELPPRCCSSSGARRSAASSGARCTQLKYAGERRLAEPLGEAIARRWRRVGAGGDLLVPVPVHAERRRERGYDQAVLLAGAPRRPRSACPRRPSSSGGGRRSRSTTSTGADRAANVAGAFATADRRRGAGRRAAAGSCSSTTSSRPGATLAACAPCSLEAGALGVSCGHRGAGAMAGRPVRRRPRPVLGSQRARSDGPRRPSARRAAPAPGR